MIQPEKPWDKCATRLASGQLRVTYISHLRLCTAEYLILQTFTKISLVNLVFCSVFLSKSDCVTSTKYIYVTYATDSR